MKREPRQHELDELIALQDRNPRLKAKADALMTLLNLNIAELCCEIEEGFNSRRLVRELTDDALTTMAAGVEKHVKKMAREQPYATVLLVAQEALQKEAVRRGLRIPEVIVVHDADVSDRSLSLDRFKQVQAELGIDGQVSLSDLLFSQIVHHALAIMTPVLDDQAPIRPLLEPLTSYKVENLAVFFNVCLDIIAEEGDEMAALFGDINVLSFLPQMKAMLAICCDVLAERGAPVPKQITLERRMMVPSSGQFQA